VVVDVARALRAKKRDGDEHSLDRSDWSRAGAAGVRSPGPATAAAAAEESRALARRFLALAPEHRRVIGLRQFEGLSARETAARMGRTETAVHSLYRRALAAWEAAGAPGDRESRSRGESSDVRRSPLP
jgi:DNA-directed RNA polymerase specialized sigma24 family protein